MQEVVALGEVLIDFTPVGKSGTGNPVFERNPGGAPANVLSLLSKLGISTAFIGKVGDDMFGHALKEILDSVKIDTSGLVLSKRYNTTLTFVELDEKGDRTFGFIRNNGADKMLEPGEVNLSLFNGAKVCAGDAFLGGILYCLLKSEKRLSEVTADDVDHYMRFANSAGSLVTTKKGAILSMPTLSQINELLHLC